jgi:predicted AlkP superfamily phosphohydrolase/phosphomutase
MDMTRSPRLAVIGLDSAPPELVFDRFASDMPTLTGLRERGLWGPLRSVVPPITVPAWSCMMSGRTPGELGIYGFRNRTGRGYEQLGIATSAAVKVPRIWDLVGEAGAESVLLGVPGTYPPPPIRGQVVGDFLAPSTSSDYTYPTGLRDEVRAEVGEYMLDVEDFRSNDKVRVAQQLFDMTEQRFAVARALTTKHPWEFFAMVDMGPDRLHHGFWKYCDPGHPRHESGPYLSLFRDYYRALDSHLAALMETLDDDTAVLVVSDHGAKAMQGGFCLNEWLVNQGLLVLAEPVVGSTPIGAAKIDWRRTIAWGDGGYYGRIFLNVAGREPYGTIPAAEYEAVRDRIAADLESLTDHQGNPMGNRALRPEMVYPEVVGYPPDLIVYFGDLEWRAVGTLGLSGGLYTFENDTGPDDANHAETGIAVLCGPGVTPARREGMSLLDIAPTIQSLLGLSAPPGQRGLVLA